MLRDWMSIVMKLLFLPNMINGALLCMLSAINVSARLRWTQKAFLMREKTFWYGSLQNRRSMGAGRFFQTFGKIRYYSFRLLLHTTRCFWRMIVFFVDRRAVCNNTTMNRIAIVVDWPPLCVCCAFGEIKHNLQTADIFTTTAITNLHSLLCMKIVLLQQQ